MRPVTSLVHARARVRPRYALMPLEGFPFSRLPTWPDAQLRVLASPALGAQFVQYLIDLPPGKRGSFPADSEIETFLYVLSGTGFFTDGGGSKLSLPPGQFALVPPGGAIHVSADAPLSLIVLRKHYEGAPGVETFATLTGTESTGKKKAWPA